MVYSLLAEARKKQTPVTAGQRSIPAAAAGTNPLRRRGPGQFERALRVTFRQSFFMLITTQSRIGTLIALPGGRLQALGIAWDSRPKDQGGQRWFHRYPDQKLKPGDPAALDRARPDLE